MGWTIACVLMAIGMRAARSKNAGAAGAGFALSFRAPLRGRRNGKREKSDRPPRAGLEEGR